MAKRTATPNATRKPRRSTGRRAAAAKPRRRAPRAIALRPTVDLPAARRGERATRAAGAALGDTVAVTLTLRNVHGDLVRDPEGIFTFRRESDRRQIADQARLPLRGAPVRFTIPAGGDVIECEIDLTRYRFARSPLFIRAVGFPRDFDDLLLREPAAWRPDFTPWANLSDAFQPLQDVLDRSADITVLEGGDRLPSLVEGAYDAITEARAVTAKTALLNIYYRLRTAGPPIVGAVNWFSHVEQIIAIGRERFLAFVKPEMATLVRDIARNIDDAGPDFESASASLHLKNVPPSLRPRVTAMVSIKSTHRKGNYQLTITELAAADGAPAQTLLDADIDESGTFWGHAGDLFKHKISGGTHPVDVHEILVRQDRQTPGFDLGYRLA